MANKSFNLVAELLVSGPGNLNQVVRRLESRLGNLKANIHLNVPKDAPRQMGEFNKHLRETNTLLSQVATNAQAASGGLRRVVASMNGVNRATASGAKAQSQAAASMKQMGANTAVAVDEIREFGRISALAVRRFLAFSIPAGLVVGLTVNIRQGIGAAIDFERQMARVQQVTGKTANNLRSLSAAIRSTSIEFGVSSAELIDVSRTLSQAGLNAKDTAVAMRAIAKTDLSPTFDSMTQTTEGAIAAMRQFKIEADELEDALGSINAVAGSFAVESGDLMSAVRRAGGSFQAAGGDLEELLALFTSVRATTRESAETIGTGFRTIFTRMQRPRTIEFLKQFGVQLQDMQGKFVGPYEAVRRLSTVLNELDPRDVRFARIMEELGGFRQVSKVIPLIQQNKLAQEAYAVALAGTKSVSLDAAIAQQTLAVRMSQVFEEYQKLYGAIVKSDTFQGMADAAMSLAKSLKRVVEQLSPMIPLLKTVAAIKLSAIGFRLVAGMSQGLFPETTKNLEKQRPMRRGLGFNSGGVVPGSGTGDRVPAMLEAGEFVIRKRAVDAIGVDKLSSLNKYAGGTKGGRGAQMSPFQKARAASQRSLKKERPGGRQHEVVGGVMLHPVGKTLPVHTTLPQQSVPGAQGDVNLDIQVQSLPKSVSNEYGKRLSRRLRETVVKSSAELSGRLGVGFERPPNSVLHGIMQQANITDNTAGQMFEASLKVVGGSKFERSDSGKIRNDLAFDFSSGLPPNLKSFFPALGNIQYIDAKRSIDTDSIRSIRNKAVRMLRDRSVSDFKQSKGIAATSMSTHDALNYLITKANPATRDALLSLGAKAKQKDAQSQYNTAVQTSDLPEEVKRAIQSGGLNRARRPLGNNKTWNVTAMRRFLGLDPEQKALGGMIHLHRGSKVKKGPAVTLPKYAELPWVQRPKQRRIGDVTKSSKLLTDIRTGKFINQSVKYGEKRTPRLSQHLGVSAGAGVVNTAIRNGNSREKDILLAMQKSPHYNDILNNHIPFGSRFLGAGDEAAVFRKPFGPGDVVRISDSPRPRPQLDRMLQPLRRAQYGPWSVEELEYAHSPANLDEDSRIFQLMQKYLTSQGVDPQQLKPKHIGKTVSGKYKILGGFARGGRARARGIMPTVVRREPWQMTPEEYMQSQLRGVVTTEGPDVALDTFLQAHFDATDAIGGQVAKNIGLQLHPETGQLQRDDFSMFERYISGAQSIRNKDALGFRDTPETDLLVAKRRFQRHYGRKYGEPFHIDWRGTCVNPYSWQWEATQEGFSTAHHSIPDYAKQRPPSLRQLLGIWRHEFDHTLDIRRPPNLPGEPAIGGFGKLVTEEGMSPLDALLRVRRGHHARYQSFDFQYMHRQAVKAALQRGLPVPQRVLAAYPDLMSPVTKPKSSLLKSLTWDVANVNNQSFAAARELLLDSSQDKRVDAYARYDKPETWRSADVGLQQFDALRTYGYHPKDFRKPIRRKLGWWFEEVKAERARGVGGRFAAGGKTPNPAKQAYKAKSHALRQAHRDGDIDAARQLLSSIMSPRGRVIAQLLLQSQYFNKIAQRHIPPGTTHVADGLEATVLKQPHYGRYNGSAVRITPFDFERPKHELMVQPTHIARYGRWTVEELPFMKTATQAYGQNRSMESNRSFKAADTLSAAAAATGLGPIIDDHEGNFGFTQHGRLKYIDPSMVESFATREAHDSARDLRDWFDDGGIGAVHREMGRFAKGGKPSDTVPALLTPGEFVVNRESAQRIGYTKLQALNQVRGYADGGVVQKFATGGGQQRPYQGADHFARDDGGGRSGSYRGVVSGAGMGGNLFALTFTLSTLANTFTEADSAVTKFIGVVTTAGYALGSISAVASTMGGMGMRMRAVGHAIKKARRPRVPTSPFITGVGPLKGTQELANPQFEGAGLPGPGVDEKWGRTALDRKLKTQVKERDSLLINALDSLTTEDSDPKEINALFERLDVADSQIKDTERRLAALRNNPRARRIANEMGALESRHQTQQAAAAQAHQEAVARNDEKRSILKRDRANTLRRLGRNNQDTPERKARAARDMALLQEQEAKLRDVERTQEAERAKFARTQQKIQKKHEARVAKYQRHLSVAENTITSTESTRNPRDVAREKQLMKQQRLAEKSGGTLASNVATRQIHVVPDHDAQRVRNFERAQIMENAHRRHRGWRLGQRARIVGLSANKFFRERLGLHIKGRKLLGNSALRTGVGAMAAGAGAGLAYYAGGRMQSSAQEDAAKEGADLKQLRGKVRAGRRVANIGGGILAGAATGAMLGGPFAPVGAAIGAAVGGLGGLITTLITSAEEDLKRLQKINREAANERESVELDKVFGQLLSGNVDVAGSAQGRRAAVLVESRQRQRFEASLAGNETEAIAYTKQLMSMAPSLIKWQGELLDSVNTIEEFRDAANGGATIIRARAEIEGKSIAEVTKAIQEEIEARKKARDMASKASDAAIQRRGIADLLGEFTSAIKTMNSRLGDINSQVEVTSSLMRGETAITKFTGGPGYGESSRITQGVPIDMVQYERAMAQMIPGSKVAGSPGEQLFGDMMGLSKMLAGVPSILRDMTKQGALGEDVEASFFEKAFGEQFGDGPMARMVQNTISANITKFLTTQAKGAGPGVLYGEYKENPAKMFRELAGGSFEEAFKMVDEMSAQLLVSTDMLDQAIQSQVQAQQHILKQQLDLAKSEFENRRKIVELLNPMGDGIGLEAIEQNKRRRIGMILPGQADASPAQLGQLLRATQDEIVAKNAERPNSQNAAKTFSDELVQLNDKAQRLRMALQELADVGDEAAQIQHTLNKLEDAKKARYGLAERYTFGTRKDRAEILRDHYLAARVGMGEKGKRSLKGIPEAWRPNVLGVLKQYWNVPTVGLQGEGHELAMELITNDFGPQFKPPFDFVPEADIAALNPAKRNAEEQGEITTLKEVLKRSDAARAQLITDMGASHDDLVKKLHDEISTWTDRLSLHLAEAQLDTARTQLETVQGDRDIAQGQADKLTEARGALNQKLGTNLSARGTLSLLKMTGEDGAFDKYRRAQQAVDSDGNLAPGFNYQSWLKEMATTAAADSTIGNDPNEIGALIGKARVGALGNQNPFQWMASQGLISPDDISKFQEKAVQHIADGIFQSGTTTLGYKTVLGPYGNAIRQKIVKPKYTVSPSMSPHASLSWQEAQTEIRKAANQNADEILTATGKSPPIDKKFAEGEALITDSTIDNLLSLRAKMEEWNTSLKGLELVDAEGIVGSVEKFNTEVNGLAKAVQASAAKVNELAKKVGGSEVDTTTGKPTGNVFPPPAKPATTKAAGGPISFQPRGTDTVPAMLTPGEFVVKRSAAQKHMELLQRINSGKTVYAAEGGLTLPNRSVMSNFSVEPLSLGWQRLMYTIGLGDDPEPLRNLHSATPSHSTSHPQIPKPTEPNPLASSPTRGGYIHPIHLPRSTYEQLLGGHKRWRNKKGTLAIFKRKYPNSPTAQECTVPEFGVMTTPAYNNFLGQVESEELEAYQAKEKQELAEFAKQRHGDAIPEGMHNPNHQTLPLQDPFQLPQLPRELASLPGWPQQQSKPIESNPFARHPVPSELSSPFAWHLIPSELSSPFLLPPVPRELASLPGLQSNPFASQPKVPDELTSLPGLPLPSNPFASQPPVPPELASLPELPQQSKPVEANPFASQPPVPPELASLSGLPDPQTPPTPPSPEPIAFRKARRQRLRSFGGNTEFAERQRQRAKAHGYEPKSFMDMMASRPPSRVEKRYATALKLDEEYNTAMANGLTAKANRLKARLDRLDEATLKWMRNTGLPIPMGILRLYGDEVASTNETAPTTTSPLERAQSHVAKLEQMRVPSVAEMTNSIGTNTNEKLIREMRLQHKQAAIASAQKIAEIRRKQQAAAITPKDVLANRSSGNATAARMSRKELIANARRARQAADDASYGGPTPRFPKIISTSRERSHMQYLESSGASQGAINRAYKGTLQRNGFGQTVAPSYTYDGYFDAGVTPNMTEVRYPSVFDPTTPANQKLIRDRALSNEPMNQLSLDELKNVIDLQTQKVALAKQQRTTEASTRVATDLMSGVGAGMVGAAALSMFGLGSLGAALGSGNIQLTSGIKNLIPTTAISDSLTSSVRKDSDELEAQIQTGFQRASRYGYQGITSGGAQQHAMEQIARERGQTLPGRQDPLRPTSVFRKRRPGFSINSAYPEQPTRPYPTYAIEGPPAEHEPGALPTVSRPPDPEPRTMTQALGNVVRRTARGFVGLPNPQTPWDAPPPRLDNGLPPDQNTREMGTRRPDNFLEWRRKEKLAITGATVPPTVDYFTNPSPRRLPSAPAQPLLDDLGLRKYHQGGYVNGTGEQAAILQGGEYVLSKQAVQALAKGGVVKPQYRAGGGTISREGGGGGGGSAYELTLSGDARSVIEGIPQLFQSGATAIRDAIAEAAQPWTNFPAQFTSSTKPLIDALSQFQANTATLKDFPQEVGTKFSEGATAIRGSFDAFSGATETFSQRMNELAGTVSKMASAAESMKGAAEEIRKALAQEVTISVTHTHEPITVTVEGGDTTTEDGAAFESMVMKVVGPEIDKLRDRIRNYGFGIA